MSAYDIHQRLRTKATRQHKKKSYDEAIKTLSDGSIQMLQQKEQGSGCDLAVFLVDVYDQAGKPCDKTTRDPLIQIIQLAQNDFWRKKVIDAAVKWSVKATRNPAGDAFLRLAIADVLVKEGSFFQAEAQFIAACVPPPSESSSDVPEHAPKAFALAHVEWLQSFAEQASQQPGETREADVIQRIQAGRWALRGVMPLLSLQAPQAARGFLSIFLSRLVSKHPTLLLPVTPNPKPYTPPAGAEGASSAPQGLQLYVTANSELNFSQMALALSLHALAAAKTSNNRVPDGLRNAWIALVRQFERESDSLHEAGIGEAINPISTHYFQLQTQKPQGNFMQDMLSSLMGGGGGNSNGQNQIAGSEAKQTAVQPLIIKQAPQPQFKSQGSAADGADDDDDPADDAVDAPEEEDLD